MALKVAPHECSLVTIPSYITPRKCSLATILFSATRIDGGQVQHKRMFAKGTFMKGDCSMEMVSESDLIHVALLSCAGARIMQGVRGALLAFTMKFECLEKHLERRIEQQIEKVEQKLHKTEAKLYSAVCHCMAEIMKQQTHLQRKQDQLTAKQDLLHTTIVHDQCPLPPPIMTSPPP